MSDPVKLNDRVFGFLRDSADSEPLYKSMQANLHSLFEYVDSVQGRFRETLNAKDVQYLLAFKEHMTSTTMQIEQLRRELQSKQRLDMSVKAIELRLGRLLLARTSRAERGDGDEVVAIVRIEEAELDAARHRGVPR